MTNDPRLERYLTSLEVALKSFPVSDRAEIITEIKSHVLSALERDPQTRLDTVLNALGEPETVANRYLLERGMKPATTSIHPIVKWLVIGFLGTLAMLLIFTGSMLYRFGSLVKVDNEHDRVQILGGLIDIEGKKGEFSQDFKGARSEFSGSENLGADHSLAVRFNAGKFEITTSEDGKFNWDCKGFGASEMTLKKQTGTSSFDLSKFTAVKCKLGIPVAAHLVVNGANGKIDIVEPDFDLKMNLENGKITFQPSDKKAYKYDVSVVNGSSDEFESSKVAGALAIELHLANGKIRKETKE